MKISQLLKREDFYSILKSTLFNNSYFKEKEVSDNNIRFSSYARLNIILSEYINNKCRNALINEYRLSTSIIKRIFQYSYIKLAFTPLISRMFIHKQILLAFEFSKYAIVGGNHRIRLFENGLESILILLKNNENPRFIHNDIKIRVDNQLTYAPRILGYGTDWLKEEYIHGIPLNRINNEKEVNNHTGYIINKHQVELIEATKNTVSINFYLETVVSEMQIQFNLIKNDDSLKKQLNKTMGLLIEKILAENIYSVETAFCHGDFQKGNIRISPTGKAYVLDWESSDYRFFLYDLFVIISSVRHGVPLSKGLTMFSDSLDEYVKMSETYSRKGLMFITCLEELRFHVFEDISNTYFKCGTKFVSVAKEIDAILNTEYKN